MKMFKTDNRLTSTDSTLTENTLRSWGLIKQDVHSTSIEKEFVKVFLSVVCIKRSSKLELSSPISRILQVKLQKEFFPFNF